MNALLLYSLNLSFLICKLGEEQLTVPILEAAKINFLNVHKALRSRGQCCCYSGYCVLASLPLEWSLTVFWGRDQGQNKSSTQMKPG